LPDDPELAGGRGGRRGIVFAIDCLEIPEVSELAVRCLAVRRRTDCDEVDAEFGTDWNMFMLDFLRGKLS
jgi:hypothetical protein